MTNVIEIQHLSKAFGDHVVLKDINFSVRKGEVVSIIGSSGSGKSTLLRCINLLEKPSGGKILYNGINILDQSYDVNKYRAKLGMVFQHFNLFNNLDVLGNCTVAQIQVLKRSKEEAEEIARNYLRVVGMEQFIHAKPRQLSGGQKQRVAMARALVMRPKIMLFDEVTSALDPELVGEVLEVIRDLAKHEDMAMVLVTHEMDFALDIADKVLFLDEGIIAEQGTAREVIEQSDNARLQEFLRRFRK